MIFVPSETIRDYNRTLYVAERWSEIADRAEALGNQAGELAKTHPYRGKTPDKIDRKRKFKFVSNNFVKCNHPCCRSRFADPTSVVIGKEFNHLLTGTGSHWPRDICEIEKTKGRFCIPNS